MYQWLIGGSCAALGSAAATLSWMWAKRYGSFDANDAARESFSLARYEPMKRLLSEEDFEFLKRLPGIRPARVRQLRAQRRKVFRSYLRELASDFNRLHRDARLLLAAAPEEYSDLVPVLMGVQMRFWTALAGTEIRLTAHAVGMGNVDVSRLLGPLEALSAAVRSASEPELESI